MKRSALLVLLIVPTLACAETAYVSERLRVSLRAEPAVEAPIVKSVDSGDALEVIERRDGYAQVRDSDGVEGWIDARLLSVQPTAMTQLKTARTELAQLRQQVAQLQARPGDAPASATGELQTQLAAAQAQIADMESKIGSEVGSGAKPSAFRWVWPVIAFAMLLVGFIGGVVWVRESIRRRSGGMYLRV